MPLPPYVEPGQVEAAAQYIQSRAEEFVPLYYEQPNIFSAVVGILGTIALDSLTPYEKNPNKHTAATRFPDLVLKGAPSPAPPQACLECKASKRPWAVDSHYDHEGWYIVWRYLVDSTKLLGSSVVVWRVDCAYLTHVNWVYRPSKAGQAGGGRTHTFNVKDPSKVFAMPVFLHPKVAMDHGKPVPRP